VLVSHENMKPSQYLINSGINGGEKNFMTIDGTTVATIHPQT